MNNPFPFTPRDYQITGRYDVNKSINDGGHPLLVMPTRTGKTKTIIDEITESSNEKGT